jgi:PKD repeat protein
LRKNNIFYIFIKLILVSEKVSMAIKDSSPISRFFKSFSNYKWIVIAIGLILLINSVSAAWTSAGGCWTDTDGTYNYTMWNATGTTSWKAPTNVNYVAYLVVGGGGAGGDSTSTGGGGGAGGMETLSTVTFAVTPGTSYTVIVGAGGTGVTNRYGNDGGSSNFSTIGVNGGGGGGGNSGFSGRFGGSGGGGAGASGGAGSGTSGEGSNGGSGASSTSGGGGGAGGAGGSGTADESSGAGGAATASSINGTSINYAGGGGACGAVGGCSSGGSGAGSGAGGSAVNGRGGGGSGNTGVGNKGGDGGSGTVIIKYMYPTIPVSSWNQNKSSGPYPLPIQFQDYSSPLPITSWNWSFGNSLVSTSQNPTTTYSNPGIYNVNLTTTNSNGSSSVVWYREFIIGSTPNANPNVYDKKLYLPMNGTDKSQIFYDYSKSNNTVFVTTDGAATSYLDVNTTQSKFGGASARIWSSAALVIPFNNTLDFGGNDFYIGWWENSTARPAGSTFMTNYRTGPYTGPIYSYFMGYANDGGQTNLYMSNSSSGWDLINGATMGQTTCATWSYNVITRNGTSVQSWKNGVIQSDTNVGAGVIFDNSTAIFIGGYHFPYTSNATSGFYGFVDDLVIYNGRSINGTIVPTRELLTNPKADFLIVNVTSLTPGKISLYDQTLGDAINAWNWTVGGANFSNSQNPTFTLTGAGNYSVKLNVSGVFGNDTITKYVTVYPALPTANFTSNLTTGVAPLTVNFTDNSTGTPIGWSWLFGDENWTKVPWVNMSASSPGWAGRFGHATVSMPDGAIIIMGGSDGTNYFKDVWRSTDNGATWTQMTSNAPWETRVFYSSTAAVATPDGSIILTGGTNATVQSNDTWLSSNNGTSWTLMNASSGWSTRVAHGMVTLNDGSVLLVGGQGGGAWRNDTWRSIDDGRTWTLMNVSSGWSIRQSFGITALPDGGAILTGGTPDGAIDYNDTWRTTSNGATWDRMNTSSGWTAREYATTNAMSDGSLLLMGGINATSGGTVYNDVWRSTDQGKIWTRINASAGWGVTRAHATVLMRDGAIIKVGGLGATATNDTWRFNPTNATTKNPTHLYSSIGLYNVSLQVYTALGVNSTRKISYINASALSAPVSSFTKNLTIGNGTSPVQFNDTSTNTPTGWNWSFQNITGNGTQIWFSTARNATNTFGVGNFSIRLNASNSAGYNISPGNISFVNITAPSVYSFSVGKYTVVVFNGTPGYVNWTCPANITYVEYLVIAGGAGGGTGTAGNDGGGGAGGLRNSMSGESSGGGAVNETPFTVVPGNQYTVIVGNGGIVNVNGTNSSFSTIMSIGGGRGGSYGISGDNGFAGGSGGGSSQWSGGSGSGGAGTANQGYSGGTTPSSKYGGSGGGGAGHAGNAPTNTSNLIDGGRGGNGTQSNITGILTWYAGGGSGSSHSSGSIVTIGGYGGGGNGHFGATLATNGSPNTGSGGGGGGESTAGGAGGSGIVIIRYSEPTAPTADFTMSNSTGYSPLLVNFTDTSTDTPTSWNWTFGAANFSNGQNPHYTFNGVGNYSVTLNASNSYGYNTITKYVNATLQPSPVASFIVDVYNTTLPLIIQFNDTSTNDPITWNWYFRNTTGNNTQILFSIIKNATNTFGVGNFSIKLNVSNAGGGYNMSLQNTWINVTNESDIPNLNPISNFTYNNTGGIQSVPVQFNDTGSITNIDSWNWTFGDGNTSTQQNPLFIYDVPGTYNVSLNVTNISGYNLTTKTNIITITGRILPIVNFTYNNTGGIQTVPIQFNDTGSISSITSWNWSFGDGNFSSTQKPIWNYSVPGIYSVSLNITNASGFNSTTKTNIITITGRSYPIPNFTANITFGLQDLPVQFDSTTSITSITAWNWTFGDGNFSNAQNPVKIYSVPGIYNVKLNITNASGFNSTTYVNYIEVKERILPVSDFTANVTLGIQNMPVQFTDNSLSAINSWNWTFGDGNTSTLQNPLFIYSVPGTYSVSLNVTNTSGSNNLTKVNYIKVTSRIPPIPNFTANKTYGLIPLPVQFTDDSKTTITAWNWSFGDGNFSNAQNPLYTYQIFGNYTVTLTVQNASATNSTTKINYTQAVYIDAAYSAVPNKALSTPATIAFYDTSIGTSIDTWSWNFGDGYTSSAQNPSHTYSSPGLYTIQLTSSSSSTGFSDTVVCTQCMNIQNVTYTSGGYPAFNYTDPGTIDIVNSSGMDSWMYYMMVTNKTGPWQFPIVGFATGIMDPFVSGFEGVAGSGNGNIVYLILWGLFILMVWRNSGKITIPALIGCITAGAWSLLFPQSAQPWVSILIAAALASQLLTFFAKE